MADDPALVKTPPPKRTEERLAYANDLAMQVLIERAEARSITAAEIQALFVYLKNAGIRPVIGEDTKTGEAVRKVPKLPPISDEEKVLRLG